MLLKLVLDFLLIREVFFVDYRIDEALIKRLIRSPFEGLEVKFMYITSFKIRLSRDIFVAIKSLSLLK